MWPEFQKILYATNLGPEAPYVFRYALSLAGRYNAEIHILHAVEPLTENVKGLVEFFLTEEKLAQQREEARSYLLDKLHKRLARFCTQETCKLDAQVPDPVREILVQEGHPAEMILSKAKTTGADLIVMGTHRTIRESGRLLGSTARSVVNRSKVPVLTVYTPKEKFEDLNSQ
ncbi:MAG: universal stress protein [Desulfobacteraceae bacterium]|nr:universal stress protein [Desulfobacteraceae bacterium]